jgi:hypothetical protein
MRKQKLKLKGENYEFVLEVDNTGFVLWTKKEKGKPQVWVLDASTLCDSGEFSIGRENQFYGFTVKHITEKYEFGGFWFALR